MDPRTLWRGGGRVVPVALLLVLVQLGFRGWALAGSWFQFSDANFVSHLLGNPLTASLLLTGYAGHLMPGAFLLTELNDRLGTLEWAYPAAELLALQALADLGAVVFLVSAFGRRWGILPPLAVFLFTVLNLPAAISWGPGITQLPFLAAIFWGSWAQLRYLRTRRLRWALATMAITVVALLFGEKTLLVLWVYAFLALGYFATGDVIARIRTVTSRYLPGVVLYTAVTLGYAAWYLVAALNVDPVDTADQSVLPIVRNLAADAYATGILGGPLRWDFRDDYSAGLAAPGQLVTLVAVGLLLVLGWEVSRTRSRSKRAWLLVALMLVSDVLVVTAARAVFVGADVALLYRYLSEMGAISAIALGLATMPLRGAVETVETIRPSRFLDQPVRVLAATAAVCLLGTYSSATYAQRWHDLDAPHDFYAHAEHDLTEMATTQPGGAVPLADTAVPTWLIWGLAYPDNLVSHALGMFGDQMTFPRVALDNLYAVGSSGNVGPVVLKEARAGVPRVRSVCPFPARNGVVEMPLDGPVLGSGWWVRASYYARETTPVRIAAGDEVHDVTLTAGLHNVFFTAGGQPFEELRLERLSAGSTLCVTEVVLGSPVPLPAS